MAKPSEAVVVDASLAAKWHLSDESDTDKALLLLRRFVQGRTELWAPEYIRYEVPSAITKATRGRRPRIQPDAGREAIGAFLALGIRTLDTSDLILTAYPLVHRYGCSLYDALYLALSESLSIPLLTADARFHRTVRRHPSVVWIRDYVPPDDS